MHVVKTIWLKFMKNDSLLKNWLKDVPYKEICYKAGKTLSLVGLVLIIIGTDQLSKYQVLTRLAPGAIYKVSAFLNLQLGFNHGMAFGLLAQYKAPVFIGIITIILSSLLSYFIYKNNDFKHKTALSLMLAGALSNLLDRMCHGYVTDFIDFHFKSYHWYAFNIADAAICIGAIWYCFLKELK